MKIDIFNTDKKYDIIYADPPWAFRVWSERGARTVRRKTLSYDGKTRHRKTSRG